MTKTISRYLILTFCITYIFWGLDIVLSILGYYEHPAYNIGIVFYVIAACSPAVAVFILWRKEAGKKGVQHLMRSAIRIGRPIWELSLLVIFLLIRFGIPFLFGSVRITGSWVQVVIFIPVMFLFGGLEEVGWRGFLQPLLEKRFGFVVASLINFAVWLVWHIPLCFIKGTYQYSGNYLWFALSLLGSAFALAALHKIDDGIMPCILFHAIGNSVVSYGLSVDEGAGTVISSIVQVILAIAVACVCSRKQDNGKI